MRNRKYLDYFRYMIGLSLFGASLYMIISADLLKKIDNFDLIEFFNSILLALTIFLVSGIKLNLLLVKMGASNLKFKDMLLLPITMNFWGFIIPFKGGMLYSFYYLKKKYSFPITVSSSATLFGYLFTLLLAGISGVVFFLVFPDVKNIVLLFSLILCLSPFILILILKSIIHVKLESDTYIRIKQLAKNIYRNIFRKNLSITFLVKYITIIALHILIKSFWYKFLCLGLGVNMSFLLITLLVISKELLMIFRFTPGNLGVSEIITGGITSVLIHSTEIGLLIASVSRIFTMLISFIIGPINSLYEMRNFKINSLNALFKLLQLQKKIDKN